MLINIGGIQRSSLLDYPNKISAIVFTVGCNFRCGYCHNPELVDNKKPIYDVSAFFNFLKTRKGKLDAVVISGGEPCLQKDLIPFIKEIKSMGYLVKLDTNGTYPDTIEYLINNNLIDYIAMDIKAPLKKYSLITNTKSNTEKISKSISLIKNSNIDYEFRTTVLKNQLSFEDFEKIGELLEGSKTYYLQKFVVSKILDESLNREVSYSNLEFELLADMLRKKIDKVFLR